MIFCVGQENIRELATTDEIQLLKEGRHAEPN